jgi:endonuclease-3
MKKSEMYTMDQRVAIILKTLKELFPHPKIALNYTTDFELLVAVILSAQCTDKLVNKVTEPLFKKYTSINDYVDADPAEFEQDIHSVNFYRNKAKNILATADIIKEKYGGKVPDTMEDLLSLPGVARKTANVVLGNIYHKIVGIVVDTHVKRLSQLYGLTKNDTPEKIEQDLMKIIPKEEWFELSYRLIDYGRAYCTARPHDHANCPLTKVLGE